MLRYGQLVPPAECGSCTDSPIYDPTPFADDVDFSDGPECMSCYKCCRCQRCEDNRLESSWLIRFPCPACGCLVWATGCAPYLCICTCGQQCATCCDEDIEALSAVYLAEYPPY